MKISRKVKAGLAGALAVAIVAGGAVSSASAADTSAPPSLEAMYLWNNDETFLTNTSVIGWGQQVLGYPKDTNFTDYDAYFTGTPNAQAVYVFLSPRGDELDPTKWVSKAINGFADPAAKTVLTPNLAPENTAGVNLAAAKANGGQFSLGLAYTDGNAAAVYGVTFVHITVQPGGNYTYEPTVPAATPPAGGQSKDIDISATVQEAPGSLTFTVPTTSVTLATAINATTQLSESTGSISGIEVSDTRRTADRKGWDLTQSVANFTSGGNTIDKKNFGVAVTKTGGAAAASAAAPQVAGSATYPSPFASSTAGVSTEPTTQLKADLKLVAPAGTPAGTYTSKLTLTLVSK
ncbi:hypothetical protein [Microbacterium sp. 10M-3C3]|uniref:hypothetical protein n=1 Tax=Microbacterium sp. 10M-3C3 TaxID=2483401 RepID=UPI000F6436AB|nr:hypothetical protein [Microbacterium sp. 10M-3C3]